MTAEKPQLFAFGLSDIGKKRLHNEDGYTLLRDLNLFMVADGMGGHAAGETASKLALRTVQQSLRKHEREIFNFHSPQGKIADLLVNSLRQACHCVHLAGSNESSLRGMGTTLTAVLVHAQHAHMAHVGDSRLYLFRAGVLQQLSEDHSLVHEQVKLGFMTEEQASNSRLKNIITRSIGYLDDVDVDYACIALQKNDILLLCSDGLSNLVTNAAIAQILLAYPVAFVPQQLIKLANANGGDDNITVIVVGI